jgi:hypothetical protein
MEGISAVTARISEIRALVQPARSVPASATALASGTSTAGTAGTAAGGPSFADALARAIAPPGAQPVPPTGTGSALSVAQLQGTYANGQIPAAALSPINAPGHRLAAPAAAAFDQLQAAARRDGVTIGVNDSYRSHDEQVDLVRRKGLYSQGGLAAAPGTSQHGWGLAVDLDLNPPAQAWMRANAAQFGFAEDTPREPWHWAFKA